MNPREKCIPPKNIVGGNKDIIGRLISINLLTTRIEFHAINLFEKVYMAAMQF